MYITFLYFRTSFCHLDALRRAKAATIRKSTLIGVTSLKSTRQRWRCGRKSNWWEKLMHSAMWSETNYKRHHFDSVWFTDMLQYYREPVKWNCGKIEREKFPQDLITLCHTICRTGQKKVELFLLPMINKMFENELMITTHCHLWVSKAERSTKWE